ncbi:hypothetical protein OnM2_096039, partial [Erysiphe neolycopersici]
KWRRDYKPPKGKSNAKSQDSTNEYYPKTPPIVTMASSGKIGAFYSTEIIFQVSGAPIKLFYNLERSWILDSCAKVHVCNDRSRFIEFNSNLNLEEILWVGESQIRISGHGKVIYLQSPKYPSGRPLTPNNIAFVPSLNTNVTSFRLLNVASAHWDTNLSILQLNGRHFANTPMMFSQ